MSDFLIKILYCIIPIKKYAKIRDIIKVQDLTFDKMNLGEIENLVVFLLPEAGMSGGILSIYTIAQNSRDILQKKGVTVMLATLPNKRNITYCKQENFESSESIFRFQQIFKMRKLKTLLIHIPEYKASSFFNELTHKMKRSFLELEDLKINILNQNITLMPEKEELQDLYKLTDKISQTTAHYSYSTQEFSDKYQLPTSLIPARIDIGDFEPKNFDEKENVILYSPDKHECKKEVLNEISKDLPDFKLIEIKSIKFEEYMKLITKAKFMITFGEGYDGYLLQPHYQGSVSFAVYNTEFFPSADYKNYMNIFGNYEEMIQNITRIIRDLNSDAEQYRLLSEDLIKEHKVAYDYDNYVDKIKNLYEGNFDFYPNINLKNKTIPHL